MITGELKNRIDMIRQTVWNSGVSNPMTVVDQLTYLMFIHSLDEKEIEIERMENIGGVKLDHIFPASEIAQSMRWSKFKDRNAQDIYRIINDLALPAIKEMKGGRLPEIDVNGKVIPLPDGYDKVDDFTAFSEFMRNVSLEIREPVVLQKVITLMDELFECEFSKDKDLEGDFYEYMLNQMSSSGELGQFRTPKHIRDMMVELLEPTPDDLICDPACGTAGFISSAVSHIREPIILPFFSCHTFRHTFCTRFCENENNVKVIQSVMGHSDIQTTMNIYAEVTESKKRESIEHLSKNMRIFRKES